MSLPERIWYGTHPLKWALAPLSLLFAVIGVCRRWLFQRGFKRVERLPVPVIVVGNLTAGGTGKTPLTAYLARELVAGGFRPGIVSRGYGGKAEGPTPVGADSDPAQVGDEPVLLARAAGVPVVVCRDRAAAGRALLAAHPQVDVLLCDDGLQHYRLGRDVELCVVDGMRGFGNGWQLPAGPLREPRSRLAGVDAVVVNGGTADVLHAQQFDMLLPSQQFKMILQPGRLYRLDDPTITRDANDLAGETLAAVCGIGNPARFFATLAGLGLTFSRHAFADHHAYAVDDLPAGMLVTTEKDAVKLAARPDIRVDGARIWVLPVNAMLSPDLGQWLATRLQNGRKAA
ncbi:tetraacyldisaccharide 4'-kinase [Jeongeupia naejangsanensis]|uniref:Tetraacyldisaccharide 4'-kinase n=1 Tax=Jeongeupia naejangsanensis TaxID=613195 RepID=A0ABS2BQ28_9NEIS|nr:tetraacyldisaccharide 4'-kinase [Jeongeupia naejangsanensis]MBM3117744.1 tetraacyldisaccharide 4'-kinase [Jeongeupia naejangsanensis]